MFKGLQVFLAGGLLFFASLPSTSSYSLQSYGFGSGGTANSGTATYSLEGLTGEASGNASSTATYSLKSGFVATQQANDPVITLANPNDYYDKLTFSLDTQNNPTDATYAIEVSTSSTFASGNSYVQPDDTLGATLATTDYQTISAWTSSGDEMIGLSPNTIYYARSTASQGKFTESGYGPSSSAATVGQQLSYCMYTNTNCAGGGSSVAFGGLTPATIAASPNNIGINFATNADGGGNVYVVSKNGALTSSSSGSSIASATTNLASASSGYGAQVTSATDTSGGPFSISSPYNGTANNVGQLSTTLATILSSTDPVTGGSGSIQLQVLPSNTTSEATDYTDTLTLVAAASF